VNPHVDAENFRDLKGPAHGLMMTVAGLVERRP
jgi:hypothetical protein